MKVLTAILLLSSCLWVQTDSRSQYPLILTVTSAHVSSGATGATTQIMGYLSDDPQKKPVRMVCNVAMSSLGPDGKANTYPARYGYQPNFRAPKHITIYAREPGKDDMREYKCSVPPN